VTRLPALLLLISLASGSAATFDQYIEATEAEMNKHRGFEDFLWLDHHPDQKSLVWLGESVVLPMTPVPGNTIQHWLGAIYLEGAALDPARNVILNFDGYKVTFKQQVMDSKLIQRDGEQFKFQLELYKKQISAVRLNVDSTAKYTLVDPGHIILASHSTHISEAKQDESEYLQRLNFYWRLGKADNGVYAELEVITQGQEAGKLSPGRYLKGFQNFPRELTQGMIDGLRVAFPRRH
jgi:hypothetical protein